MAKYVFNYDSGEYEYIERDGFSIDRGEYVYNWDDSEYRREEEEEEERRREERRKRRGQNYVCPTRNILRMVFLNFAVNKEVISQE